MRDLRPGHVLWLEPEIAVGREQAGRRPALVVSGSGFLTGIDTLVTVVPLTSVYRRWPNHVEVTGADLEIRSWAMSEQLRTVSRDRIIRTAGAADDVTLLRVRRWVADFLDSALL